MKIPNDLKVILIAEDSLTQAENLRYFLERHGYQVVAAKNGREALDMVARHKPHLLISDIVMPEMDGYQLCHSIRSGQDLKDLPIIFLTVLSDPVDIMKSLECGADGFIIKPFKEEPLIERIRLLLASQDLRKSEEKQEPVEVVFRGKKFRVNADRLQIMNLLISTYEAAVETNSELLKAQRELQDLNAALETQSEKLRAQNDKLVKMAEEQQALTEELAAINEELATQAEELTLQKEEQERLNDDLRSKQQLLEEANEEMESFSYSVSHDLKTPVRTIEGFSRMLMGEHTDKLDAEALRLVQVITTNTKLMHHLIDDLLGLSRLGRLQVRKSVVNLAVMTSKVFEEIRAQAPTTDLQLTLGDLPPGLGDQSLLHQVVQNLLANAVKFTKSRQTAVIEVGGCTAGKENIYYVKDNGVGFDERYLSNLFRPFQRLHPGEEYEGTGVGLAIVKRIIQRHGGRVWAQGKVNEGATFYFALPNNRG